MTLMAHRFLDALQGKGRAQIVSVPGEQCIEELRTELINEVPGAEKFDFQTLPLEPNEKPGMWKVPDLTPDEIEFWNTGLVPLPGPRCWYEFSLGKARSAYYVKELNGEWGLTRIDERTGEDGQTEYVMDGVRVTLRVGSYNGQFSMGVHGPRSFIEAAKQGGALAQFGTNMALAMYLTLMLSSRTTQKTEELAPAKLNKKRVANGHVPLFSHRVVNLVPSRFRGEDQGGTHASPRLHWRRSHLRRYDHQTAGSKWSALLECFVTVIPRFLVGRAELGEVSHEYRVPEQRSI